MAIKYAQYTRLCANITPNMRPIACRLSMQIHRPESGGLYIATSSKFCLSRHALDVLDPLYICASSHSHHLQPPPIRKQSPPPTASYPQNNQNTSGLDYPQGPFAMVAGFYWALWLCAVSLIPNVFVAASCSAGYAGQNCNSCVSGYFYNSNNNCKKCPGDTIAKV